MKKLIAMGMAGAMSAALLAGCGGAASSAADTASTASTGTEASSAATTEAADGLNYSKLTVGTDGTDLTASLKILTQRTDLIEDGTFDKYISEFNAIYPNISIKYEGMTDYANDMTTRLTSNDWGDICMVPTTIPLTELGDYFEPLCSVSDIENDYNFASNRSFDGTVYGIPSTGNVQGIVYNKAVFEKAGIDKLPTTPDEFLDALQKIKDNTDAIPLYTNYAAGWTMSAWDAYIGGGATGDADWMNITMPQTADPFAPGVPTGDAQSGPYAVYYTLYEAVKRGLTEDDPTTTDWEGCKPMMPTIRALSRSKAPTILSGARISTVRPSVWRKPPISRPLPASKTRSFPSTATRCCSRARSAATTHCCPARPTPVIRRSAIFSSPKAPIWNSGVVTAM